MEWKNEVYYKWFIGQIVIFIYEKKSNKWNAQKLKEFNLFEKIKKNIKKLYQNLYIPDIQFIESIFY